MRYVKLAEVCARFAVDEDLLRALTDEGVLDIEPPSDSETLISVEDAERLRVAVLLIRDLEVNIPGAEVILRMREELLAMQRDFQEILGALVEELRRQIG